MSKTKFKDIISSINSAPTGGFVGITDYVSSNLEVVSITGRIGTSYGELKKLAIEGLKNAIANEDFEDTTIEGKSWSTVENGVTVFHSRKGKGRVLAPNIKMYKGSEVLEFAKGILVSWETPSNRTNNVVELSAKENGLGFNINTGTFTFKLVVDNEYYKADKSAILQEGVEIVEKPVNPDTKLKDDIRSRFLKKIKTYSIAEGKFKTLTVGGHTFESDNITM